MSIRLPAPRAALLLGGASLLLHAGYAALVPLAPQAVAILRDLHPLTAHGHYVFPSLLTGERPMSENTVTTALRRMGYTNDDMTAHGFRAMARTLMIERLPGVAADVIEAQLAHGKSGPLGAAYDRAEYMEQRRAMMRTWADYLDRLSSIEDATAELDAAIHIEGYPPPHDPRINVIKVTPDPGVIEVNIHPTLDWPSLVATTTALYEEAHQAAGAVGMGLSQPGEVSVALGTSGVVFAPASSYQPESGGRLHTFAYIPGMWHWMGVMLSAGGSLRWFRDALGGGTSYDDLMLEAAGVEAGCEGLLFLPYLTGERTPHADPLARGAFAGLTIRHSRGHLARAVIEGVSFGLRDSLELMRGLGLAPDQVRVSGGGAKSPLWRQILADVLNVDIVTVNSSEGAAYGAAILAAIGAQAFPDVSSATRQLIRVTSQISPGGEAEIYAENYPRYQALYPALRSVFNAGKTADQKAGD